MFTSSTRALDSALLHFRGHEPLASLDPIAFGHGLAAGTLRREWTWLAFADDTPVARGVWWGPVGAVHPVALRCLIVDPTLPHPEVWGAALIRSAHRAFAASGALLVPDFEVAVESAERGGAAAERALGWRRLAARDAGLPVETTVETTAEGDADGASFVRTTFSTRALTVAPTRVTVPAAW